MPKPTARAELLNELEGQTARLEARLPFLDSSMGIVARVTVLTARVVLELSKLRIYGIQGPPWRDAPESIDDCHPNR